MKESIISGKANPGIDPDMVWHWEIPFYLFAGGLAAGLIFFAALFYIRGKEDEYSGAVKRAVFFAPVALILGLGALFLDLTHKLYFWQLYTTIRFGSPMSWGAWILLFITPLSILWCMSYIREFYPDWDWKLKLLSNLETWVIQKRMTIAWVLLFLSVILGIYTGILLSAFNARPLWNSSILGPLFLVSGLSTGAALIMWVSNNEAEKHTLGRTDLVLIGIEIFFIIHLFMGFLASPEAKIEAASLFLGGSYTLPFWIFVVAMGLLLPSVLEAASLRGKKIPAYIPSLLILAGGVIFRFIMVYAGQTISL